MLRQPQHCGRGGSPGPSRNARRRSPIVLGMTSALLAANRASTQASFSSFLRLELSILSMRPSSQ